MERQWSANSGLNSTLLTNIAKMVEFDEVQVTAVPLKNYISALNAPIAVFPVN